MPRTYTKEWYEKNKETIKERSRRYREQYKANLKAQGKWEEHLKRSRLRSRQDRAYWKHEAITLLGGKCAHCGETRACVLQIDHIHGGGKRKGEHKGHVSYYRKVVKSIRAGECEYQLLCANCNWIKRCTTGL